jgi:hypothetical protein
MGAPTPAIIAPAWPVGPGANYIAPRDGTFWFTVQTEDVFGRREPANVAGAAPLLKVCVDTSPPATTLRASRVPFGQLLVDFGAKDDNPDPKSVVLEYRVEGTPEWIPVREILGAMAGTTTVEVPARALEVRVRARDLAGNVGESVVRVPAME